MSSSNNLINDTELTVKCLRYLFLPSLESSRTRRSLNVEEIPVAAKQWKSGNLERFMVGSLKCKEEDCGMDDDDGAWANSSGLDELTGGTKNPDSINIKRENVPPVPVPLHVKSSHLTGKGDLGKEKEEMVRTNKYLAKGNFNPPRRLQSSPKSSGESDFRKEVSRPLQNKCVEMDDRGRYPPSKNSLFSTHQKRDKDGSQRKYIENGEIKVVQGEQKLQLSSYTQQNNLGNGSKNSVNRFDRRSERVDNFDVSPATQEAKLNPFKSAHQQLVINDRAKGIKRNLDANESGSNVHVSGLRKTARFIPPTKDQAPSNSKESEPLSDNPEVDELMQNPLMKNIDPKMVETVLNEVFDTGSVDWDDIAGLQNVKNVIKEIIIWPMLRPDIFTGLRGPPKGILLFGPPGTGKTMIGKLIATQSKSSFFNISASSLTSKWIGDGEKMVRALFAVARVKQPSVIFIDEIDSILTQRSDTEHESSRRLKTEFLIQFDGCGSKTDDRILVIGVTNRPQELDEAARRRLVKRIYIPLPDCHGRRQLVRNLLGRQNNDLTDEDYQKIAEISEGYSGADMASLCQEASYGPIRDVGVDIQNICADEVRPMAIRDFEVAIRHVKASVAQDDLVLYEDWDTKFGCHL